VIGDAIMLSADRALVPRPIDLRRFP
jgi:hypothetical protein